MSQIECPDCLGIGLTEDASTCKTCKGKGKIDAPKPERKAKQSGDVCPKCGNNDIHHMDFIEPINIDDERYFWIVQCHNCGESFNGEIIWVEIFTEGYDPFMTDFDHWAALPEEL